MKKKKKDFQTGSFIDYLLLILVSPLLALKAVGDLFIKTYKVFKIIIRGISFLFLVILNLFQNLTDKMLKLVQHDIRKIKTKKVIFRKIDLKEIILGKMPKIDLTLPKITLPESFYTTVTKIKYLFLGALLTGIFFLFFELNAMVNSLPNPASLKNGDITATTKIYDRNGTLLYEIYADENRTPVKLAEVPKFVKEATIAIEDKEFYRHEGFSVNGIIRAIVHNLSSDNLEGGSTITQQLIRSAFLTPEKTWERKIKEIILSIWTEKLYTKDQILEMYLNQVPYGGTAWGIEAASQNYFGKSVGQLTLSQAVLLAGLPASPSRYSPFSQYKDAYKTRQLEVLKRMHDEGYIKTEEYKKAKEEPLEFKEPKTGIAAPHFVIYVKELLENLYGAKTVEKGGLRVTTTLDLSLQQSVEKILAKQIENIRGLNVGNGAVLITNPQNGEILTMVGSADYFDTKNNGNVNVTQSLRQPGSSIKAVTYAAALTDGFTAASILDDSPVSYRVAGQPLYSPVNYDGKYHGKIPLRVALASSYNIPAVKVLNTLGVKMMIDQGKKMGITSWNDESRFGLSLTLGGGEVSMLDMAKVYGTLGNEGIRTDLSPFIKITNVKGETLPLPDKKKIKAVPAEVAFILSHILSDNSARTPAFGPNSSLYLPGKTVAVKTGTSDNKRDNWTIGYTPDYAVVTWVGNNDNSPMNPLLTSGVTGAAPIWNEIMKSLLSEKTDKPFIKPDNVIGMPCLGKTEYFIKGTEPKGGCVAPPTIPN